MALTEGLIKKRSSFQLHGADSPNNKVPQRRTSSSVAAAATSSSSPRLPLSFDCLYRRCSALYCSVELLVFFYPDLFIFVLLLLFFLNQDNNDVIVVQHLCLFYDVCHPGPLLRTIYLPL